MDLSLDTKTILDRIEQLSERVEELARCMERIHLIVCGDGINGLADRISAVELSVCYGENSLLARIAHLERTLNAALVILRGILIAVGSAVAVALLRLVIPLLK